MVPCIYEASARNGDSKKSTASSESERMCVDKGTIHIRHEQVITIISCSNVQGGIGRHR